MDTSILPAVYAASAAASGPATDGSWEATKLFANSAFATSLVGALAGAFAGAMAAQRIAERSKARDELARQIRNTNAAITLAFSILNSLLGIKKQHVTTLVSSYEAERERFQHYIKQRKAGLIQGNAPYILKGDMRTLTPVTPPVQQLEEIVFTKLSAIGRPLSLMASLVEAVTNLNATLARRNELIALFKGGHLPPGAQLQDVYFGLPYGGGHQDREYGDIVGAIGSYCDDGIFFSKLLSADLTTHGNSVAAHYRGSLGEPAPLVNEVDFAKAVASGLLPDEAPYQSWFSAFVSREQSRSAWWQRNT